MAAAGAAAGAVVVAGVEGAVGDAGVPTVPKERETTVHKCTYSFHSNLAIPLNTPMPERNFKCYQLMSDVFMKVIFYLTLAALIQKFQGSALGSY